MPDPAKLNLLASPLWEAAPETRPTKFNGTWVLIWEDSESGK